MDDTPRRIVHKHVSDFFDGTTNHEGWYKSQYVPVPEKGNLSDPNKWQGIMLMDVQQSTLFSHDSTCLQTT